MVGALVYMHSRYIAAKDLYEEQVEAEENEERDFARNQPSTNSGTGAKYSQVWEKTHSTQPSLWSDLNTNKYLFQQKRLHYCSQLLILVRLKAL